MLNEIKIIWINTRLNEWKQNQIVTIQWENEYEVLNKFKIKEEKLATKQGKKKKETRPSEKANKNKKWSVNE